MNYFDLTFQCLTDKDGAPVREVQLFKKGTFEKAGTKFTIDDAWLEKLVKNYEIFASKAKDKKIIPLDYNHSSMNDHHEEAIAAGWLVGLKKKDDGVYGDFEFTPRAAEYVKNKEYRYISPEFNVFAFKKENGEIVDGPLLQAAALTNRPFLKGMAPVELSDKGNDKTNKEETMQLEKIGKVLSLTGEFGEKEIVTAIEKISKPTSELRTVLKLKDDEDVVDAVKKMVSENETQKTAITSLTEKVEKIATEQKETVAKEKVKQLMTEGKCTKAMEGHFLKIALSSPEDFDKMAKDLPVIVSVKATATGGAGENPNSQSSDGDAKKEMQDAVLKLMSDEKIKDYGEAFLAVQKKNPELAKRYAEAAQPR